MIIFIIIVCAALVVAAAVLIARSPKFRGNSGERAVSRALGKTVKGRQYVINDLLFGDGKNKSCQIDHVLINRRGVWVIETKNYAGTIYGDESQREWTQVLARGNVKNKFYNPVKQNATHIYNLSKYLKLKDAFINVVVFIDADVSRITAKEVTTLSRLNKIINKDTGINLTDGQMQDCYNKLLQLKNSNKITKRQHVKNINKNRERLKKGICPRCGGRLVIRNGAYGDFYGCSNYPKCKFTADVSEVS